MDWTAIFANVLPWPAALAVWYFTRHTRETFKLILDQHQKDRDYWRGRAIEAERELRRVQAELDQR